MANFREAKKTLFKKKIRSNGEYFTVAIPPHVIEREKLKKGDEVRFIVDSVKEDG